MDGKSPNEQLANYDVEYSLRCNVMCTDEENQKYLECMKQNIPLPDNIWKCMKDGKFTKKFAKIINSGLTHEEENRLLMYKQIEILKEIRFGIIFFVVLTCISIGLGILSIVF